MRKNLTVVVLLLFMALLVFPKAGTAQDSTSVTEFTKVEVEAFYPGGESAWRDFLGKNLNANVPVDNGAPVGKYTVFVQFVVNIDGSTSDVEALTKMGYGMEREVIQLIKKSGKWTPAVQDGRPVKAYRKQPVIFMVTQDGLEITSTVPYVLFTGTDNELMINVRNTSSDKMRVVISQGAIINKGNGKFTARVSKPGRAILQIYGKKDKKVADVSFEVKDGTAKQ